MKRAIVAVSVLVLPLTLAACGEGEMREVSRAASPDGGVEAVVAVFETKDPTPYLVAMVKPGEKPGKGARLFLADRTEPPAVSWSPEGVLTVSCKSARIWSFRNFWTTPDGKITLPVKLECGQQGWGG
jgi:hypothetical protein